MRKEKHRSVGASGFFLERPGEGHGGGGGRRSLGSLAQGPVPSSTLGTQSPQPHHQTETRNQRGALGGGVSPSDLPGQGCVPSGPRAGPCPLGPQGRATSPWSPGKGHVPSDPGQGCVLLAPFLSVQSSRGGEMLGGG